MILATVLAAVAPCVAKHAAAEEYMLGSLAIGNPWTRATPKGATVAGAYLTISNRGAASDRLIGGSCEIAARLEIHSMTMQQGVAIMRPLASGLEIRPGETVELKPGSLHMMLTGLKRPLAQGERVKCKLQFEKAGDLDIEYAVGGVGATAPSAGGHHH